MSIDWSNTRGTSFVTGPRNQGGTNACWLFAATALVESMVRIEHGAWCARSEGDGFTGMGYYTFLGGNVQNASNHLAEHGLADPDCLPWSGTEFNYTFPYSASPDRAGRIVKLPGGMREVPLADQKTWLDTVGPITAAFDVHDDFFAYWAAGTGVYRRTGAFPFRGSHVVLVIGYDDVERCWIAKNSWGAPAAHPGGIFRIGFGEVMIDDYAKLGLQGTNPDPATKRRHHAGGLLVSGNGAARRNLELVAEENGAVRQWFKDPGRGWRRVGDFAIGHPFVQATVGSEVTATQTTFNRNFEAVWLSTPARPRGGLQHWVFSQKTKRWDPASPEGFGPADADGTPAFIQSNFGEAGSFEVVVRTRDGRLSHWTRRNSRPWQGVGPGTWVERARFGADVERSAPALVQTRAGDWPWGEQGQGTLELVCVAGSHAALQHWQWDGAEWTVVEEFAGNVEGIPCMIESMDGPSEWAPGPLRLFAVQDGGVMHYERQPGAAWEFVNRFAGGAQSVVGVAQGHTGLDGIDVVVREATGLQHWRITNTPRGWTASSSGLLP